jgi:hypothetical protein
VAHAGEQVEPDQVDGLDEKLFDLAFANLSGDAAREAWHA